MKSDESLGSGRSLSTDGSTGVSEEVGGHRNHHTIFPEGWEDASDRYRSGISARNRIYSVAEERLLLHDAFAKTRKPNRQLHNALSREDFRKAKSQARHNFLKRDFAIIAAHKARKAFYAKNRWMPFLWLPTLEQLASLTMDRENDGGEVRVFAKRKPGAQDAYRLIYSYALVERTRQVLFNLTWGKLLTFHDRQFGVPGRGTLECVKVTSSLIKTGRYQVAAQLDIKSCFDSVIPAVLGRQYGIPKWVISGVLTNQRKEELGLLKVSGQTLRDLIDDHIVDTHRLAKGLPQGASPSSSLVYGLLKTALEKFVEAYEDKVAVITYCDNFLLLAETREAMDSAIETLTALLETTVPAANFRLHHRSSAVSLSDGIEFLGFQFAAQTGEPIVSIPVQTEKDFKREFLEMISSIYDSPAGAHERTASAAEAAKFTLSFLNRISPACNCEFDLIWSVVPYLDDFEDVPEVRRLFKWINRRCPTDEERLANLFADCN